VNNRELTRQIVLGAIADDYEEPNHIYQDVEARATTCGIPITVGSVQRILLELVEQGLAKAYILSPFEPVVELDGAPRIETIANHYFWITPYGLTVFRTARDSNDWPFDEEGDLKVGWTPSHE
jgi:hypothetical protein